MPKRIKREFRAKKPLKTSMTFYLAGPIHSIEGTGWLHWREVLTKFLLDHGHNICDPAKKYEDPLKEKQKLKELIKRERSDITREYIRRRIIEPDIALADKSNAIIAYLPDYSMGTISEIFYFYKRGLPVYIVSGMPREKISPWMIGLSTVIFPDWDALIAYIEKMED